MPKKATKNPFYFFMVDFKEEQKKKGINYRNMQEVAEAANPHWRDAPQTVRAKYEAIAKKEKQKATASNQKYTSTGVSFAQLEHEEREIREAQELERKDITSLINLRAFNNSVKNLDVYLMDVNYFCQVGSDFIIGECTLLRFNIQDGIKDAYHELVNPGKIPLGYTGLVKEACADYGLIMPDESTNVSNYMKILAYIVDYLKQDNHNAKILPPIFTLPSRVEPVMSFIHQMCQKAAEDETIFRVYKLDTLFYTMLNALKTMPDEGFPKESLALVQLKKDPFKYTPGIACEHHEATDRSVSCTSSRVKRWAYTVLDACCPAAGVRAAPASHVPSDLDLDSIQIFQEQKKERIAPSVACYAQALSSCNTSIANESFNVTSNNSTYDSTKREKRVHVPLRMPKADYSQAIRVAPELTEAEFPSLAPRTGRGRGLASSLNKLKLDK